MEKSSDFSRLAHLRFWSNIFLIIGIHWPRNFNLDSALAEDANIGKLTYYDLSKLFVMLNLVVVIAELSCEHIYCLI